MFPEEPECIDMATASQQAVQIKIPIISKAACKALKTKYDSLTLTEIVKLRKLCKGITAQTPSDCQVGERWSSRYGCVPDLSVLGPFDPY